MEYWKTIVEVFTIIGGLVALIQVRKWLLKPVIHISEFDIYMPIDTVWNVIGNPAEWKNWMFGFRSYGELPASPRIGSKIDTYLKNKHLPYSSEITNYKPKDIIKIESHEFSTESISQSLTRVRYKEYAEYNGVIEAIMDRFTQRIFEETKGLVHARTKALQDYLNK